MSPATGDLAGNKGSGTPEINRAHHPDELLQGDPDRPDYGQQFNGAIHRYLAKPYSRTVSHQDPCHG